MFENFKDAALCTPRGQFDKDEFFQELYDSYAEKIVKRSSTKGTKAEKVARAEKFKANNTVESYGEKMWNLMVDEDQIIPQDYWYPRRFFTEGTALARLNPHFMVTFYEALNRYEPTGDTLVLLHCKETKPYSSDPQVKMYTELAKQLGFDLAVLSASIVPVYPYDSSKQYPFFVYNWPSNRDGQYNELVTWWSTVQLGYMIAKHRYKRVILISSGNYHYDSQFLEAKKQIKDVEWIHIGENAGAVKKVLAWKTHKGVASVRLPITIWGRMCLISLFDKNPDDYLANCRDYEAVRDEMIAFANKCYPEANLTMETLKDFVINGQYSGESI